MRKGVGEHLFTFVYLSVLTGHMCRWKLLQRLYDCIWSNLGGPQGQTTHTTSVYGPWALVVAKVWKRRILLSLLLLLFSYFLNIYIYFSLFFLTLFSWQGRANIIIFFYPRWPLVWMELCSEIFTTPPYLDFCVKVKCAMLGVSF